MNSSLGITPRLGINPAAMVAAYIEITHPVVNPQPQPLPGVAVIYKPGDAVVGPHGNGTVTGYNHSPGVYDGRSYPYCVQFEDGYADFYSDPSLQKRV